MIVAETDAGNGGEHIEVLVSIDVSDVVTDTVLQIDREVLLLVAGCLTIRLDRGFAQGTRIGGLENWGSWFVREASGRGRESTRGDADLGEVRDESR